ncbi:hypothetical protein N7468_009684 [Penicillium chermesinum]|uniref:Uncharacterized protein n=1 Tax=Penicillium chermesinum TaxID=63820 RepID=A0A9W9NIA0_9EURO|nr:uncharacterized protein N7468_009684 [Penicillium chermesinum]KAJ5220480.1 hypothetical protein N7468_009684 [Penicillium chermesinum]KAJ6157915.1 hypothetical protein N7470_005507 [Penicillium chermesinum]
MTFREKVKRVFHRSSSSESQASGKPKVEYYRRHEVPPSKFRGPFDKEHQKRLAAWSFERATVDRTRSLDLSLSPCATANDCLCDAGSIVSLAIDPGMLQPLEHGKFRCSQCLAVSRGVSDSPISPLCPELSDLPDLIYPTDEGSQSDSAPTSNHESYSGSMMTLQEGSVYELSEDPVYQFKESIRYTSPIARAKTPVSPCPMPPSKHLPFSPEDLTRALLRVA